MSQIRGVERFEERIVVIRGAQMAAFEGVQAAGLSRELLLHVKRFAPELARAAGDDNSLRAVETGRKQAAKYGFVDTGLTRFYIEVICVLGSGFDTDPQYPWAAEILSGGPAASARERADRLYNRLKLYLHEVAGPNNEYLIQALRRLLEVNMPREGPRADWIVSVLASAYPQKYEAVTADRCRELVRLAENTAAAYGLTRAQGTAITATLMFACGHNVAEDAFYPWVSSTLLDKSITDANGRTERLIAKSRVYLSHALEYLTGNSNVERAYHA